MAVLPASPPCPLCAAPASRVEATVEYRDQPWQLRRCRGCGLHFVQPLPSVDFLQECYAGDYHAELRQPGATEAQFGAKYRRYVDYLAPHLPAAARVLDIGCSTGLLVKMLQDRGYRAEGIEINATSAAWGRDHYGIVIHDRRLEECPLEPGSLDAVLMTDVLEHTRDPRLYLEQVGRLLKPSGVALIVVPDIRSVESRYLRLVAWLTRRPRLWKNLKTPLHIWEFTPATAHRCFQAAGFRALAFHRHQSAVELGAGAVRLIRLPLKLLETAPLAGLLGTQLEFIIGKQRSG